MDGSYQCSQGCIIVARVGRFRGRRFSRGVFVGKNGSALWSERSEFKEFTLIKIRNEGSELGG